MAEDGGDGDESALEALTTALLEDRFAQFDMQGKRFDAPGMPADAVVEVAAFRRALFAVARQLWLNQNPGRTRVPPHVLDKFDLRLVGVGSGSAKPIFRFHADTLLDNDTYVEWQPLFYEARDELTKTVRAFAQHGRPSPGFPRECLDDVMKLGTSLLPEERVVVGSPEGNKRGAAYTHELKAKVLTFRREVIERGPQPITVIGVITAYDSSRRSFDLKPSTGGPLIHCRIGVWDVDLARSARDSCSLDGIVAPDVSVSGNTDNDLGTVREIEGVTEVVEVRSVWEKKVAERLAVLRDLEDGWHGPSSRAPSEPALLALEAIGLELRSVGHPIRIGATTSGSIAIEWTQKDGEYTAEIQTDMTLVFFVDEYDAQFVRERESNYSADDLLKFVQNGTWQ